MRKREIKELLKEGIKPLSGLQQCKSGCFIATESQGTEYLDHILIPTS